MEGSGASAGERESARARRAAFVAPLVVLALVGLTHVGARSGAYASTLPERRGAPTPITAVGYAIIYDGAPVNVDALKAVRLADLFRGARGEDVTGFDDERCLPPLLQAMAGSGFVGALAAGTLLNFLAAAAAVACAVDLVLRLGRGPLAAAIFGVLVAATRGTAFYVGLPDAHMIAFAWVAIAAWLFDRLALHDPRTPRAHAALFAIAAGASLLCYQADVVVLAFLWMIGLGRTPLARLFAITLAALGLYLLWHPLGRALGLGFDTTNTKGISEGLVYFAKSAKELTEDEVARAPAGGSKLALAVAIARYLWQGTPGIALRRPLLPAFGLPLCLLALAGFLVAARREKRLALALFLPSWAAAVPVNVVYDVPRVAHPGAVGLALLAAIGLGALPPFLRRELDLQGVPDRIARAIGLALALGALGALVLHENRDLFGDYSLQVAFHYGG